mmetsp:Transcript_130263/g.278347  ORF Transcript_130263/g.278347 Transcript_130263/m.278347 type:complete len:939 (+) Transcript_130263:218-3034(+)
MCSSAGCHRCGFLKGAADAACCMRLLISRMRAALSSASRASSCSKRRASLACATAASSASLLSCFILAAGSSMASGDSCFVEASSSSSSSQEGGSSAGPSRFQGHTEASRIRENLTLNSRLNINAVPQVPVRSMQRRGSVMGFEASDVERRRSSLGLLAFPDIGVLKSMSQGSPSDSSAPSGGSTRRGSVLSRQSSFGSRRGSVSRRGSIFRSQRSQVTQVFSNECLKQVELLRKCEDDFVEHLMDVVEPKVFQAGAEIMTEGDEGTQMCFLIDGTVEVFVGPTRVTEIGDGGCFGEIGVLGETGTQRTATVKAVTFVVARMVERDTLWRAFKHFPLNKQVFLDEARRRIAFLEKQGFMIATRLVTSTSPRPQSRSRIRADPQAFVGRLPRRRSSVIGFETSERDHRRGSSFGMEYSPVEMLALLAEGRAGSKKPSEVLGAGLTSSKPIEEETKEKVEKTEEEKGDSLPHLQSLPEAVRRRRESRRFSEVLILPQVPEFSTSTTSLLETRHDEAEDEEQTEDSEEDSDASDEADDSKDSEEEADATEEADVVKEADEAAAQAAEEAEVEVEAEVAAVDEQEELEGAEQQQQQTAGQDPEVDAVGAATVDEQAQPEGAEQREEQREEEREGRSEGAQGEGEEGEDEGLALQSSADPQPASRPHVSPGLHLEASAMSSPGDRPSSRLHLQPLPSDAQQRGQQPLVDKLDGSLPQRSLPSQRGHGEGAQRLDPLPPRPGHPCTGADPRHGPGGPEGAPPCSLKPLSPPTKKRRLVPVGKPYSLEGPRSQRTARGQTRPVTSSGPTRPVTFGQLRPFTSPGQSHHHRSAGVLSPVSSWPSIVPGQEASGSGPPHQFGMGGAGGACSNGSLSRVNLLGGVLPVRWTAETKLQTTPYACPQSRPLQRGRRLRPAANKANGSSQCCRADSFSMEAILEAARKFSS